MKLEIIKCGNYEMLIYIYYEIMAIVNVYLLIKMVKLEVLGATPLGVMLFNRTRISWDVWQTFVMAQP